MAYTELRKEVTEMTYSLTLRQDNDQKEVRLYINGGSRNGVYFKFDHVSNCIVCSSSGDSRIETSNGMKDYYMAQVVAAQFGIVLGKKRSARATWDKLVASL